MTERIVTAHFGEDEMTSEATSHRARRLVDEGGWLVSWLPGRVLTRDQATTAMMMASTVATEPLECGGPMWSRVEQWARELGLTGAEAVALCREPASPSEIDPGPVPEQVEPEPVRQPRTVTVGAAARRRVTVTTDIGRSGRTGLTLETAAGDSVTVALTRDEVDAVCDALLLAPAATEVGDQG